MQGVGSGAQGFSGDGLGFIDAQALHVLLCIC